MRNKISKKRMNKMIDSGFSGLSTAEIQNLIQTETEKDESEIDTHYIDLCFELLALNQNHKSAKIVRYRKPLQALIAAAVAVVFFVCTLTVSAQVFNFNIPQEIARFFNGTVEIDVNLEKADTTADGYALTETDFAKKIEEFGISPITFPEELLNKNCEIIKIENNTIEKTMAYSVKIDFEYQGEYGNITIIQYAKDFEFVGIDSVLDVISGQSIRVNGMDILVFERNDSCTIRYRDNLTRYDIDLKCDVDTAIEFAKTIK